MDLNTYKCSLDEETLQRAITELHENPSDRIAACKALDEWIRTQPHLKCPERDALLLLSFLRGAKWSQLRAREMIDGYLTIKTQLADWFQDLDARDPKILALIDAGYAIPLPKRDKNGSQLILMRMGQIDPTFKRYTRAETIRLRFIAGAIFARDEMTQVNGVVFILDFTGVTMKILSQLMNRSDLSRFSKMIQKNVPGRFKAFHYYNAGRFFDTFMEFSRPFFPKKYQDRVKTHDTAESLYKDIGMELLPLEYLPDDYNGPNAGHLNELIAIFKSLVTSDAFRDHLLYRTSAAYGVDESKRPQQRPQETASFRKLNVE